MAEILLSNGLVTLVDADVSEEFGALRWDCHSSSGHARYAVRRIYMLGRTYYFRLHRIILDALPGQEVDHVSGDGLDNRRENLRVVTQAQNQRNRRAQCGSSRFKGVYWHASSGRWMARIRVDGRRLYLGSFSHEEPAARAYDSAARKYFGEHARTNAMLELINA